MLDLNSHLENLQHLQFTLNNYYLPESSSLYAIKDLDNNEMVIDFDSNYTRISSDSVSSYFDVYMNGLQPERYYKILIKATSRKYY